MTWPPPPQKTDWVDADVQLSNHPGAHNDIALTLANDYQPQIATNTAVGEANVIEIARVDAAWQQNEADRNADFVRGTQPEIRATGTDAAILLKSDVIEKYDEGGSTLLGDVLSGAGGVANATGDLTLSGTPTFIPGTEVNIGTSVGATSARPGWVTVNWHVDMTCSTAGLVNVAVYVWTGSAWVEQTAFPRGIWKTANDADRLTMAGSGHMAMQGTNNLRWRLYAWENSGAFSVEDSNTQLSAQYLLR